MQDAVFNLDVSNVFHMWRSLERVNILNKQMTKYVSIVLDKTLTLQFKVVSSSRNVVLHEMQRFILAVFESHIPKSEMQELGDPPHTLSVSCGRYIRVMSQNVRGFINTSEWPCLMELASSCMDRHLLNVFILHGDLVERRNK
jgi:hypothetical protein